MRREPLLPFLLAALAAWPAAGAVPDVLYSSQVLHPEWPAWVAADVLIDPSGHVQEGLAAAETYACLAKVLTLPRDPRTGCLTHGAILYQGIAASRSTPEEGRMGPFRALLLEAQLVLVGRVVARRYGFAVDCTDGQVVEVEPLAALRGELVHERYFVFLPVGMFRAGPYCFVKTDEWYPEPPELGDLLLVAVVRQGAEGDEYIRPRDGEQVVVFRKGGGVAPPRVLRRDADLARLAEVASEDALLERLTELARPADRGLPDGRR